MTLARLKQTLQHYRTGVRLYIGLAIGLVTLETWWWTDANYAGSSLFSIRLEETYAWLAVALLVVAVAIGPIYAVFKRLPAKRQFSEGRRLFGIGAAWFASLHATIAYVALFKLTNPLSLPQNYKLPFLAGAFALLILLAMAVTSFDKAFKSMGVWWFRLHRFVYVVLLLTLLHAFMIGTHATGTLALFILTIASVLLVGLHSYLAFVRADRPTTWQLLAIGGTFLLLVAVFNYGYGQKLGYYPLDGKHSNHQL